MPLHRLHTPSDGLLTKINLFFCHPVPPTIRKDVCPASVTCERYTVCSLCCYATSDSPVKYSWTKNGRKPINGKIKVLNDNIVITPRSAQDYGVYLCNAENSFGRTSYEISLNEDTSKEDDSECIYLTFYSFCFFSNCLVGRQVG